jgi:KAP family P-loop domain
MNEIRLKAKPIEISEKDPFKEDALSRAESAQHLTDFVSTVSEPLVLAIDSPFGTGKTTFLRMWLQHLKNQGFVCLSFNSWENDFSDSPLVSLIGEVGTGIEALKLDDARGKLAHEIFEKTKKAGAALVKAALPTALKLATSGLLDLDKATESDLGKLAEDLARKQIEKYQADKKTIENFRRELEKLVKALAGQVKGGSAKPVIFVIDELDRCRPLYAVGLLEKVKHLFSVEGLVFILAIDRSQLGESVRSLYGSGRDADGYLRRFIDLEYRLPTPNVKNFVESQFIRFGLSERIQQLQAGDFNTLKPFLAKLFELFGLRLRAQEQCFTRLCIVLRTTPPNSAIFAPLLVFLICLRDANRSLYFNYINGSAPVADVLTCLKQLPGGAAFLEGNLGITLEAHLIWAIREETEKEKALKILFSPAPVQAAGERKRNRSSLLAEQFSFIEGPDVEDMISYVAKKIEMAAKFFPVSATERG